MIRSAGIVLLVVACLAEPAAAQSYSASKLEMPPPDAVAPEVAAQLQSPGIKVSKGGSPFCEIWLAKQWLVAADAKTATDILYPLTPGQLIGVIRYPRKTSDFREQDIPAGTYILRYAHQPVDGAHVGTSPTRDFLALLPAAKDRDPKTLDYKTLTTTSKETTGTAHPAILSLQKAEDAQPLAIREVSDKDWVIVHFTGKQKRGSAVSDLPMEVVIVGKAME